jgi:hypothetical protein
VAVTFQPLDTQTCSGKVSVIVQLLSAVVPVLVTLTSNWKKVPPVLDAVAVQLCAANAWLPSTRPDSSITSFIYVFINLPLRTFGVSMFSCKTAERALQHPSPPCYSICAAAMNGWNADLQKHCIHLPVLRSCSDHNRWPPKPAMAYSPGQPLTSRQIFLLLVPAGLTPGRVDCASSGCGTDRRHKAAVMIALETEHVGQRLARGWQLPAVLVGELPCRAGSIASGSSRYVPLANRCDGLRKVQRQRPAR